MLLTRRVALLLIASLILTVSPVHAGGGGGGGTKRSSQIVFQNNSSVIVGVTTAANSSAILQAIADLSATEFTTAGGKFINPSSSATFKVTAGTYTVGAADESFENALITESVTVSKGKTVTVTITDDPNNPGGILVDGNSNDEPVGEPQ
jgi:hypothetical protein